MNGRNRFLSYLVLYRIAGNLYLIPPRMKALRRTV
jgi:hypothetical protein